MWSPRDSSPLASGHWPVLSFSQPWCRAVLHKGIFAKIHQYIQQYIIIYINNYQYTPSQSKSPEVQKSKYRIQMCLMIHDHWSSAFNQDWDHALIAILCLFLLVHSDSCSKSATEGDVGSVTFPAWSWPQIFHHIWCWSPADSVSAWVQQLHPLQTHLPRFLGLGRPILGETQTTLPVRPVHLVPARIYIYVYVCMYVHVCVYINIKEYMFF